MVILASAVAQWMPLLDVIGLVQKVLAADQPTAAAAVLAELQTGKIRAKCIREESIPPLDGRFEDWTGELYPGAWAIASIFNDGTVSFDPSEGNAQLRQAMRHIIDAHRAIEVDRLAAMKVWSEATAANSARARRGGVSAQALREFLDRAEVEKLTRRDQRMKAAAHFAPAIISERQFGSVFKDKPRHPGRRKNHDGN